MPDRPGGILVWIHCEDIADAGPGPAILQDLAELSGKDVHLAVTTNTPADPSGQNRVTLLPAPGDTLDAARHFLDHWRPDFGIVIGLPDNPQLIAEAARRLPMFHTVTSRSRGNASLRYPAYLKGFRMCLASSATEATALGKQFPEQAANIEIVGPLSDTVRALPCNDAECDALAKLLGGRPVWLAANVTQPEITMIENAHRKAFRSAHRLLLILVPDDADSGPAIAETLESAGWQVGLRSRGDEPDPDIQVYVADTKGELGLWYRLAPSTFAGGTFEAGQSPTDPFHPAALGSAVLHGPHTGASPARYKRLEAAGATVQINTAKELGDAVITLLSPDKAASLAQAGWATTTESAHVVERLAELMQAELEAREEQV